MRIFHNYSPSVSFFFAFGGSLWLCFVLFCFLFLFLFLFWFFFFWGGGICLYQTITFVYQFYCVYLLLFLPNVESLVGSAVLKR